jgi:hypothetical protein
MLKRNTPAYAGSKRFGCGFFGGKTFGKITGWLTMSS